MTTHPAPVTAPSSAQAVDVDSADGPSSVARWRFLEVVQVAATALLLLFVVSKALRYAGDAAGITLIERDHVPRTTTAHVGSFAKELCWLAAIGLALARRPRGSRRRALGLHRPTGRRGVLAAGLLCTILIAVKIPLGLYALGPAEMTIGFAQDSQLLAAAPETLQGWGLILTLLWMGPAVAFAEELIFRAVGFGWLRRHLPVLPAVILSSVVFAAAHGSGGVVSAFCYGLVLAWLYHRSASLWPGIAVHAINNITTALILAAAAA